MPLPTAVGSRKPQSVVRSWWIGAMGGEHALAPGGELWHPATAKPCSARGWVEWKAMSL